jgi:hypothetical protein
MLSVIMLSVVMLSVVMLSVVILIVVAPTKGTLRLTPIPSYRYRKLVTYHLHVRSIKLVHVS